MHELGLCDALLKKMDAIAKENELEKVNSITLRIGSLSGVIGSFMADCWTAVTDGTDYADCEMKIEIQNGEAQCLDCMETFEADLDNLVCPRCGGRKLNPISGRELTILEIEGY